MSEKFFRAFNKPSGEFGGFSVSNEAWIDWRWKDTTTSPLDYWMRMKFRLNTYQEQELQDYWVIGFYFDNKARPLTFGVVTENNAFDLVIEYQPWDGEYYEGLGIRTGSTNTRIRVINSGSVDTLTKIFPNLFNRVNEIVFHRYVDGTTESVDVYYGPAYVTGTLPLVWNHSVTSTTLYIEGGSGSFDSVFHEFLNEEGLGYTDSPYDIIRGTGFSWDIFAYEYGTGSLRDLTQPITTEVGVYRTELDQFEDTDDFINRLRINAYGAETGSTVANGIYQGYDGVRVPIFAYIKPYVFQGNDQFYGLIDDVWYYDFTKIPFGEPYDGILDSPWFALYPTASVRLGMMGPLAVGGGGGPPPGSLDPVLQLTLSPVHLRYAITQAPSPRRGLFLQAHSGSPQLSLEPVNETSSWHLPGDIWFANGEADRRGLFYADYSSSFNFSGSYSASVVPFKVWAVTGSESVFDGGTF